jgi:glycosyltransferase involved in cell wall biosynthesis
MWYTGVCWVNTHDLHVVMLLSNGYEPDRRVQKEAHTLAAAGYRVTIIAWDRNANLPPHEIEQTPESDVAVVRIRVPAGYGTGRELLPKMLLFWWRALHEIRRAHPAVVHAHDLDTLPLAWCYGSSVGIPVVFDAHEFYPGMVRAHVGRWASNALEWMEKTLVARVAGVITVGERLAAHYRAMGAQVWIVHNSQPLRDLDELNAAGQEKRRVWGVPEDDLLVIYVGMLTHDRLITPLVEAVKQMDRVWLVVGGEGPQRAALEAAACERIKVLGWVPPDDVIRVVSTGDVVYYGLDESNPNSRYFMPNLAFHALAAGRPLLVTPVGEIADVVRQSGCGVVMETASAEAAQAALALLADSDLRVTLGQRARYICQEQYNWFLAAKQLLALYRHIQNSTNNVGLNS